MNLNTINTSDAKTDETFFSGVSLGSGAYAIDILSCDKGTSKNGATSLNFKIQIGDAIRYTTLWLNKFNDDTNKLVENEYDSRRLKQLLILLKVEPSTLTEVATDKDWAMNIPQIKGKVGAVLEVTPANTKYNKKDYPKVDIVSFYIISTMQTVKEFTNNENAVVVQKEVEKLLAKTYEKDSTAKQQKFDVGSDMKVEELPF